MDLTNPQSLNRYAYVMNNPLNGVDPLVLQCFVEGAWEADSEVAGPGEDPAEICASLGGVYEDPNVTVNANTDPVQAQSSPTPTGILPDPYPPGSYTDITTLLDLAQGPNDPNPGQNGASTPVASQNVLNPQPGTYGQYLGCVITTGFQDLSNKPLLQSWVAAGLMSLAANRLPRTGTRPISGGSPTPDVGRNAAIVATGVAVGFTLAEGVYLNQTCTKQVYGNSNKSSRR